MYTSFIHAAAEPSALVRSRIGSLIPLPCAGVETSNLTPAGLSPFPAGYFFGNA